MNIGQTIYQAIVNYAEGGKRVVRVELPAALYEEYATEPGLTQMYRTLKVDVVEREVAQPVFILQESK